MDRKDKRKRKPQPGRYDKNIVAMAKKMAGY